MPGPQQMNMNSGSQGFQQHGNVGGQQQGQNQQGPSTPGRLGPLAPSVVISPSAPVCWPVRSPCPQDRLANTMHSIFLPQALPRQCRTISPRPRLVRRACCSTDFKRRPRTPYRKGLEHPSASIHRDSISQIKGSVNWKSFLDSMRYHRTGVKSCLCRSWINVTSSLTSMMHLGT